MATVVVDMASSQNPTVAEPARMTPSPLPAPTDPSGDAGQQAQAPPASRNNSLPALLSVRSQPRPSAQGPGGADDVGVSVPFPAPGAQPMSEEVTSENTFSPRSGDDDAEVQLAETGGPGTADQADTQDAAAVHQAYLAEQAYQARLREQRQRHAVRRRQQEPSALQKAWIKVCGRLQKQTLEFFEALDASRLERVRQLIRANPNMLLRTRPGTKWTALHYVSERGEYSALMALFEEADAMPDNGSALPSLMCSSKGLKSADLVKRMVSALTEKNLTPLMLACKRGHPACATQLMTRGSNPCISDREGAKMAIHYAALYGRWACTLVMMESRWVVKGADGTFTPLRHTFVTDMHGQNRYIDARTCAGLTPLHMAAWAGHIEVADILLKNGAALNPRIVYSSPSTTSVLPGSTPIHLATRKNRIHVVKVILNAYLERKRQAEENSTVPEDDPRTIMDDRGNHAIVHALARENMAMAALLDASADLEVVLATDLNQLGQVAPLKSLARTTLRHKLLIDLKAVIQQVEEYQRVVAEANNRPQDASKPATATAGKEKEASKASKAASTHSASDCSASCDILDASPKSLDRDELQPFDNVNAMGVRMPLPGSAEEDALTGCQPEDWRNTMTTQALVDLQYSFTAGAPRKTCDSDDGPMCGVCMDEPETITLLPCAHTLCNTCTRQMLEVATSSSCQCPFCRQYIGGFTALEPPEFKALQKGNAHETTA